VIDIDPKNGGNETWAVLCEAHGGEPITRTVLTPSGGRHLYFTIETPIPSNNGRIGKGIDVRCADQYALVPPSVRADGKLYEVIDDRDPQPTPEWLLTLATAPRTKVRHAPAGVELDTPRAIEEAITTIKGWPPANSIDEPSNTYPKAARLKDLGISAERAIDLMMELWCPHFDREWLEELVDHVFSYGQNDPGSDRPIPDAELFGHVAELVATGVEPSGEPLDIFGTIAPDPVLTREMLPDAPAVEYAFDVAERQGTDPAMTVCAMLATCAASIDDGIKIRRKENDPEHKERAHVNFLIGAPVGGGKTPAIAAMTAPLKAVQARWDEEHRQDLAFHKTALEVHKRAKNEFLTQHGGANALNNDPMRIAQEAPTEPQKPVRRRLVINNATIEGVRDALRNDPHGVLNEQDEMIAFIASFDAYRNGKGGTDRAFWLQTDNGGPYFVDRAEKADGGGGGFTVPNLSCSFIGGIQLDKLRDLAHTLSDDGFIQRSFVVLVSGHRAERDRPANEEAKAAYRNLIERLVTFRSTHEIELERWDGGHTIRREVEQIATDLIMMPTTPTALRGHLLKWPGKFARLVLLFHVIECVSRVQPIENRVSGATVGRARDFMVRFILPHAIRFYHEFFGVADAAGADARWIAGHILAHHLDKITAYEIARAYHLDPEKDAYRLSQAMNLLERSRWVGRKRSVKAPVKRRRDRRRGAASSRGAVRRYAGPGDRRCG
jgi:hypothetical protein